MALEIIKDIAPGINHLAEGFLNSKVCNRIIKRCNLFGKMTVSLPPNSGTAAFNTSEESIVLDLTKALLGVKVTVTGVFNNVPQSGVALFASAPTIL